MTERWAPSSAIRERARLTHPKKPEPTIDDVLWYLDMQAGEIRKYVDWANDAFKRISEAFRKTARRRRYRERER